MSAPALVRLDEMTAVRPDGTVVPLFHQGQRIASWSDAPVTLVLAGSQAGKTVIGPWWLVRQMQRYGPGDYIVAGPELTLLRKKVIPELKRVLDDTLGVGEFVGSPDPRFTISGRGESFLFGGRQRVKSTIWLGHGDDPDSLESMTAKAAWLDEAGQKKFRLESWDAVQRRLAIADGPILLTTTPYYLGWLKTEVYDRRDDPSAGVAVVNFPSIANPAFPRAVWDRAKERLPAWKFTMFHRGLFERPAGLIYDCWDDSGGPDSNVVPAFEVPAHWPRFLGMDFGGVNMAGLYVAKELDANDQPTGRYIAYREYHAGGKTIAQHVADMRRGEPSIPTAIGGAKSEDQYRRDFANAGLGIWQPLIPEVENGILAVYAMMQSRKLVVMDTLRRFRDEVMSYSRELDERGEPTEKIDDQHAYHILDCTRYLCPYLSLGLDGQLIS
jgi:hypothetical protein